MNKVYKVRVVEHIYKETVKKKPLLWDTKVYNVVVESSSKKQARFDAVDVISSMPHNGKYKHIVKAGKVWLTQDEIGVYEPNEKMVVRDENWRETIKEIACYQ